MGLQGVSLLPVMESAAAPLGRRGVPFQVLVLLLLLLRRFDQKGGALKSGLPRHGRELKSKHNDGDDDLSLPTVGRHQIVQYPHRKEVVRQGLGVVERGETSFIS